MPEAGPVRPAAPGAAAHEALPCLLLQVSDPHFGCEDPAAVQALLALAADLRPEVAVLTGDLTQRATAEQFGQASDFVRALTADHVVVQPGNHDLPLFAWWERLAPRPFARYERRFPDPREGELTRPTLQLVCVDSVRRWGHRAGAVRMSQVERAEQRLRRGLARQLRVVALHHPLAVRHADDLPQQLDGAARIARRWAAAGADIVLGGHIHDPFVAPMHERLDGLPRRMWVVQAGTAVSVRVRHGIPPSVNAFGFDPDRGRAEVRRWDFDAAAGRFVHVRTTPLALTRP
jgi:3',5'-cyclic AMP phosphodiesterase CpdA